MIEDVYDLLKEMMMDNNDFYNDFKNTTLIKLRRYYETNQRDSKFVRELKDYVYNQRLLNADQKDYIWRKIIND